MTYRPRFLVLTVIALRTAALSMSSAACGLLYDAQRSTPVDDILTLSLPQTALPADGYSSMTITVRLHEFTGAAFRRVKVRTTKGSLRDSNPATSGSTPVVAREITLTTDPAGEARTVLVSDTIPGQGVISAAVLDRDNADREVLSRSLDIMFTPVDASATIRVLATEPSLPADNASSTEIQANVNPNAQSRTVTFRTTSGSFSTLSSNQAPKLNDTALVGADGIARLRLYVGRSIETALITADIGGFSGTTSVEFHRALPTSLALSANRLELNTTTDSSIALTTTAARNVGLVTPGTVLTYTAIHDESGQTVGSFSDVRTTDSDQRATATFTARGAPQRGRTTIHVSTPGSRATASVAVFLTGP